MTTSVNNILIMLQKSIHEGDNYYDGMLLYKIRKTLHMSQYVYATQTLVIYKLVKQIIDIEAL